MSKDLQQKLKELKTKRQNIIDLGVERDIAEGKLELVLKNLYDAGHESGNVLLTIRGRFSKLEKAHQEGVLNYHVSPHKETYVEIMAATIAFHKNILRDLEEEITKIDDSIRMNRDNLTQQKNKKLPMFCIVLVSSREKLKKKLKKTLYKSHMDSRYHEHDLSESRFYSEGDAIGKILRDFEQAVKHPIEVSYLDGKLEGSKKFAIHDKIHHTFLIVDPFSICDLNKEIAQIFDNNTNGGVIIPICRTVDTKSNLYKYAKKNIEETFGNLQFQCRNNAFNLPYYPSVSDTYSFNFYLNEIFKRLKRKLIPRSTLHS